MNRRDRALLIGMVLGDGCLKLKRGGYVELTLSHCEAQLGYLEHKRDKLHSILGGRKPRIHKRTYKLKGYSKLHTEYRFGRQHRYLKLLRRLIYPEGTKVISKRILSMLNEQALAFWYMDDGGITVNMNKAGDISSFELRIATHCSKLEADDILGYFSDTWGIRAKARLLKKSGKYIMCFNTTEGHKFIKIIKPYIIPSMMYKIDVSTKTRARNIHYLDDDIV